MPDARSTKSDRDLQDAVITYLTDANLRRRAADLPLAPEQAQRAGKFARFLARRYYRDRLARSFRYSRRFGPAAEALVDNRDFDSFLGSCVLGSLAAAERVGDLAVNYLNGSPPAAPWWSDLLQYEYLFFLQAATTENAASGEFHQPGISARCTRFSWNLPGLLRRVKSGEPINEDLHHDVNLLFSRTRAGRIYVVEVDEPTSAVFHAALAQRSPAQISGMTSLPSAMVERALAALAGVGALV